MLRGILYKNDCPLEISLRDLGLIFFFPPVSGLSGDLLHAEQQVTIKTINTTISFFI